MGGDEFIDKINRCSEKSDMPYRIKFSYGMTTFNSVYKSIDEFIQHGDKLMYEEKRKKN